MSFPKEGNSKYISKSELQRKELQKEENRGRVYQLQFHWKSLTL